MIAHDDHKLVGLHSTCQFDRTAWYPLIRMFDDVGSSFVGGQLQGVDLPVIKPALTRDLRNKFTDLVQVFELCGEGCHRHDCETESRLLVSSKRRPAFKPRKNFRNYPRLQEGL